MRFKILEEYMALCEYHGWVPSWNGLNKYAKILNWRKKYIGGVNPWKGTMSAGTMPRVRQMVGCTIDGKSAVFRVYLSALCGNEKKRKSKKQGEIKMCEICGGGAVHATQCPNNPNYYNDDYGPDYYNNNDNYENECICCGDVIKPGQKYLVFCDDKYCYECVKKWNYSDWMELLDRKFEEMR